MGYVAGESILDDEFNAFVGSTTNGFEGINHVMGTGTANLGLGLTGTVATTNAGATVQASQWNALFTGMDNVQNHTNVSALASTTARSAGNTIAASAQLNTDLQALVTAVEGGSVSATALTEGSELQSSVSSSVWSGSHIVEHSFTFDGGDEARYFFNAGGNIRVKITNAAANSTSKDTSMSGLITSMGNFDLGATVCARAGSGDTLTTDGSALGYFDMTTSYQT